MDGIVRGRPFLIKNLIRRIAFRERPWIKWFAIGVILLGAFGLRMVNLTNPPLDFAPTRQLFSALKARGMYYQYVTDVPAEKRQLAISLGNTGIVEPPVLETLVAQTYRLAGEHLWIARIYSSLFWVLGGLALFLLISEFASTGPALIGTIFYLFLPFGVIASRAFLPDPLMVALIVFSLWALFRWQNTALWKWAIIFGVLAGLTIFVKNYSAFFIVGGFAGVILGIRGFRRSVRDPQVWTIGVLLILPILAFMLYGTWKLNMGSQFALRFFPQMWKDPAFYFRWAFTVNVNISLAVTLFAAMGIFLAGPRERPLIIGLWVGYLLFGMTFAYHIYSHDYYQLPLVPIVAISLAPGIRAILDRFRERNPGMLARLGLAAIVFIGIVVPSWYTRDLVVQSDYRNEPAFWAGIGDKLGHHPDVVGLTQDYGYRLAYWGWQGSTAWFTTGDIGLRTLAGQDVNILKNFQEDTTGKKYFLVTMFGELDNQPQVKDLLYQNYPIYDQTDEYVIFDLEHPLHSQP
jgi:4-amino-4-deoxy-L-arabinose transferase-like glycosyltransferase